MKKILTILALLAALSTYSYSQCDKKVLLTSSKTEYLGADGTVQRSEDEHTDIVFDKTNITITPGDHTMTGTIKSVTCDWQTPFKEGKMVLKVTIEHGEGGPMDVTITITGKDGKISFLAEVDKDANKKIRLTVDKFEEKTGS
jgi:hypothetical protein